MRMLADTRQRWALEVLVAVVLSLRFSVAVSTVDFSLHCGTAPELGSCPKRCHCEPAIQEVSCEGLGLTEIPLGIPRTTRTLRLDNNLLTSIRKKNRLHCLHNLTVISLSKNRISKIHRKALPASLRRISLDNNQLKTLRSKTFRRLVNLEWMTLKYNNLVTIEEHVFPSNLRTILLQNNRLTEVKQDVFTSIHSLRHLTLTANLIRRIEEKAFPPKLLSLEIGLNRLQKIGLEFSHLTKLHKLYLYSNSIESINKNAFSHSRSIKEINLLNNNLKLIPAGLFQNLTEMETLNLYNNDLETLSEDVLPGGRNPKLRRLYLQNNPLDCDCRLLWLPTMLKRRGLNEELFDYFFYDEAIPEDERSFGYPEKEIPCQTPIQYRGKDIVEVLNLDYTKYCEFLEAQPTTSFPPTEKKPPVPASQATGDEVTVTKSGDERLSGVSLHPAHSKDPNPQLGRKDAFRSTAFCLGPQTLSVLSSIVISIVAILSLL